MRMLNIGSLNIDYVYAMDEFVQPGETRACLGRQVHCGGKGLNQSIAMARAGLPVWHAGILGAEGGILRETLVAAGVQTEFLRQSEAPGGHTVIRWTGTARTPSCSIPAPTRLSRRTLWMR